MAAVKANEALHALELQPFVDIDGVLLTVKLFARGDEAPTLQLSATTVRALHDALGILLERYR